MNETVSISFTQKRTRWKYPDEPFVEYDAADESWCRFFGFGREMTDTITTRIPRAILTPKMNDDGTMTVSVEALPVFRGESEFTYVNESEATDAE